MDKPERPEVEQILKEAIHDSEVTLEGREWPDKAVIDLCRYILALESRCTYLEDRYNEALERLRSGDKDWYYKP